MLSTASTHSVGILFSFFFAFSKLLEVPVLIVASLVLVHDEDDVIDIMNRHCGFPSGCLLMAKAGMLGGFPYDSAKDHQGPGDPYSGQTQEWPIDMPLGTKECPRCSRPGDLPKQRVGESTLSVYLVWAGLGVLKGLLND